MEETYRRTPLFLADRFFRMTIAILIFITWCNAPLLAVDPSNDKARACRDNLKMMRDAVEKYMKNERSDLPTWSKFDDMYTMFLTNKYLPQKPVLPTSDCRYFFVMKSHDVYDWYCDLHGVLTGDERVTFRYHEFQFTGLINSKYLEISKYREHAENLRRWIRYSPTLVENIKFNYTQNPTTTLIFVLLGLGFVIFVLKNVFGP
ncbi:MAG: hypothetical protein HQM09_00905 [Candidatus Riflebacteria bacterium]|nr:hypothetical protein [Candidatus Riflebacteria bacterium]